jgi:hypothetical protein
LIQKPTTCSEKPDERFHHDEEIRNLVQMLLATIL